MGKRKLAQTVFILKMTHNEELLSDSENDDDKLELEFSDSEDEREKQDRIAKEALKSYAGAFKEEEHPEDYKLVMRKDIVESELADVDERQIAQYETVEEIEIREKREKQ